MQVILSMSATPTTPNDPAARRLFERTCAPHFEAVRSQARALTGNDAAADDLTQDCLVRAFRHWHTFTPGTSARAWLYTILRNVFYSQCRAHARRTEVHAAHRAEVEALGSARDPNPAQAYEGLEEAQRVREALENLPEAYREAVKLADLEGYSYRETADALGCPIGSVMSRLYRGRRKLAELLAA